MQRKDKITITLDKPVIAALPALVKKLKKKGFPYGEGSSLAKIHGLPRYNQSTIVQWALEAFMDEHEVMRGEAK